MEQDEIARCAKILELVSEYAKSKPDEKFIPGETWVRYPGRVFDEEEYVSVIGAALDVWITAGRFTEEFEYQFSNFLGVSSSLVVNSGSYAYIVALSSLTSEFLGKDMLKPGDEVITVAAGFPTTVNPVVQNGAVPVFADVEEGTYNINAGKIEDAVSERTKATMIAYTLGNPFDINHILKIYKEHGLYLIEDNCDALGSSFEFYVGGSPEFNNYWNEGMKVFGIMTKLEPWESQVILE